MRITSELDGGNIEVVDASDPTRVRLRIRRDGQADFLQWFYFRVSGVAGVPLTLHLENAGEATYAHGWQGYRACISYDRRRWPRLGDTTYADGVLTLRLTPEQDAVWIAYFAPYPLERHHDLIARCGMAPGVETEVLTHTLDGRDLDLVRLEPPAAAGGEAASDRPRLWLIARQHPGETMAEWWMEGFLDRLLDPADPVARRLRSQASIFVVPNMNPDGSARGHLRTNAAGANLNREWAEPTRERSPEVHAVLARMGRTGVDFCLDVHGDEALPYNFLAGPDGIPSLTERQARLFAVFADALAQASPDFQTEHGYPKARPGKANLSMCTNAVAERFGCLAGTLEQPFKDAANHPEPVYQWSPERADRLGRATVDAIWRVLPGLRGGDGDLG